MKMNGRRVRQTLSLWLDRLDRHGTYPLAISLSCTVILLACVVIAYR